MPRRRPPSPARTGRSLGRREARLAPRRSAPRDQWESPGTVLTILKHAAALLGRPVQRALAADVLLGRLHCSRGQVQSDTLGRTKPDELGHVVPSPAACEQLRGQADAKIQYANAKCLPGTRVLFPLTSTAGAPFREPSSTRVSRGVAVPMSNASFLGRILPPLVQTLRKGEKVLSGGCNSRKSTAQTTVLNFFSS